MSKIKTKKTKISQLIIQTLILALILTTMLPALAIAAPPTAPAVADKLDQKLQGTWVENYTKNKVTTATSNIRISLDGTSITFSDAHPFVDNSNRTLVPVRVISENMGMSVTWDPYKRVVGINENMFLTIDSAIAVVNGKNVTMDTAARIVNGRTYVPLRFVSENFGVVVDWERNNLGGIDVFLTRGNKPVEQKPSDSSSELAYFRAKDALLPRGEALNNDRGYPDRGKMPLYWNLIHESLTVIDGQIRFYMPKLDERFYWENYIAPLYVGRVVPHDFDVLADTREGWEIKVGEFNYLSGVNWDKVDFVIFRYGANYEGRITTFTAGVSCLIGPNAIKKIAGDDMSFSSC